MRIPFSLALPNHARPRSAGPCRAQPSPANLKQNESTFTATVPGGMTGLAALGRNRWTAAAKVDSITEGAYSVIMPIPTSPWSTLLARHFQQPLLQYTLILGIVKYARCLVLNFHLPLWHEPRFLML